jgi:hypothetical protein
MIGIIPVETKNQKKLMSVPGIENTKAMKITTKQDHFKSVNTHLAVPSVQSVDNESVALDDHLHTFACLDLP